jgi:hypothetical protein
MCACEFQVPRVDAADRVVSLMSHAIYFASHAAKMATGQRVAAKWRQPVSANCGRWT